MKKSRDSEESVAVDKIAKLETRPERMGNERSQLTIDGPTESKKLGSFLLEGERQLLLQPRVASKTPGRGNPCRGVEGGEVVAMELGEGRGCPRQITRDLSIFFE